MSIPFNFDRGTYDIFQNKDHEIQIQSSIKPKSVKEVVKDLENNIYKLSQEKPALKIMNAKKLEGYAHALYSYISGKVKNNPELEEASIAVSNAIKSVELLKGNPVDIIIHKFPADKTSYTLSEIEELGHLLSTLPSNIINSDSTLRERKKEFFSELERAVVDPLTSSQDLALHDKCIELAGKLGTEYSAVTLQSGNKKFRIASSQMPEVTKKLKTVFPDTKNEYSLQDIQRLGDYLTLVPPGFIAADTYLSTMQKKFENHLKTLRIPVGDNQTAPTVNIHEAESARTQVTWSSVPDEADMFQDDMSESLPELPRIYRTFNESQSLQPKDAELPSDSTDVSSNSSDEAISPESPPELPRLFKTFDVGRSKSSNQDTEQLLSNRAIAADINYSIEQLGLNLKMVKKPVANGYEYIFVSKDVLQE